MKTNPKVRCIIAGSRSITNSDLIMEAVVASGFDIWQIISCFLDRFFIWWSTWGR